MADQKRTGLDWEDVRIFVALARYGSLSSAARALSVTHATISRRIQSLEETLGEKLVERRPDGYVLTPAGAHVLAPANDMEAAASRLIRVGPGDMPKGLVRVNAPPSLTQSFLVTRLAKLALDYPSLDINTTTDLRNVSLERHETDIALRLGRPDDGDVIAKFAVTLGFGFYATEKWCKRIQKGEAPEFVGFDESNAHLPEALWLAQRFPRARIAFRANLQLAQADAAKVGAGIAMLPHFIGRRHSALRPCILEHVPPPRELWLITRRQDRADLSIRAVSDYLLQLFLDEQELFE
jgi:molybdate transport repressor ModE-like protein